MSSETEYVQEEKFYKSSTKQYVKMSDGAELLVYYTITGKHPSGFNIFFVPGFGTGPFSWNDLWDALHEQFNLYVLETREKRSSRVKWRHKGHFDRLGLDVKEAIEQLGLDLKKTLLIGPCFGASVLAHAVAKGWVNPAGFVLIDPPQRFKLPKALMPLAYIFPSFFMAIIGKPLLKLWLKATVPPGIQRTTYMEMTNNASGMRWKKMLPIAWWDSLQDYKQIKCPSWVIDAATDKMHESESTQYVAQNIEGTKYVQVSDYNFMHHNPGAKEFAKIIQGFIEELTANS
ncbi:MAG: alpha/beta fold hydrolase [Candidatus Heimdallarchaeaceae archaeon]